MHLFQIVPESFFKPLTSKYKSVYIDCIEIIYDTYKTEYSFGIEKETILYKLEQYFDDNSSEEMVFDDEDDIAKDPRTKANAILRSLKDCGWIEYETDADYTTRVNLFDYAATMIESFNSIIKNEDVEYQSVVSQIHATLLNEAAYKKPYEFILKRVITNTEELINGLKKLNTSIKKRIDAITKEKTAAEIIKEFFDYHVEIGSKAYLRLKTSDNISYFRTGIIDNLRRILDDEQIFNSALEGFIVIKK